MPQKRRWPGALVLGAILAGLFLAALSESSEREPPLTAAELLLFLDSGIAEGLILSEIGQRGLEERLDVGLETRLRRAGASETLIVAVRRAAPAEMPKSPPLASPPPSFSRRLVPAEMNPRTSFPARTRSVRVPVSVLDKDGQPVLGLRPEDFRVSENGKRQKVTLFSGERQPLRIALALDLSGSMHRRIRRVEEALHYFIDLLEPADEILAITFDDHARVVQDFTSDREVLSGVLNGLEPGGATALYDAAFVAIRRLAAGPAENKAVVLVSDGVDTVSSTTFDELREFARQSEVPIFAIAFDEGDLKRTFGRRADSPGRGGGPGGGGIGRRGPGGGWPGTIGSWGLSGPVRKGFDGRPLVDLADETGGQAIILKGLEFSAPGKGSDRLKQAVESIAMVLRHRYLIGYEPPEGQYGWRTIRVEVDRSATARARKGYYGGV